MAETFTLLGKQTSFDHKIAFDFLEIGSTPKEASSNFEFKGELSKVEKPRRSKKKRNIPQGINFAFNRANFPVQQANFPIQQGIQAREVTRERLTHCQCDEEEITVNWGELPHDAMSVIVEFVKADESPSMARLEHMRLVNKHWCSAVGCSVQELHCNLDCEGVADRITSLFPNLTALTSCRTTDAGISGIACLENLRILSLSGLELKSEGLLHLAGLTRLTELHLGCPQMGRHGLKYLSNLTRLASLDLSELPISGNRMVDLAGLKNLVSLKLGPMKELRISSSKKDLSSLARKRPCQ